MSQIGVENLVTLDPKPLNPIPSFTGSLKLQRRKRSKNGSRPNVDSVDPPPLNRDYKR